MTYQDDDLFDAIEKTVVCSLCGQEAMINMHVEQGVLLDYFYECRCGKIIEQEEKKNE